jgi:N utilization substance protein A
VSVLSYADNKEIINTIENIASEKNIKKEVFFDALESSFIQIAKDTFGDGYNFAARIGRANGLVEFFRILNVVENVNNDLQEITLKDAKKIDKTAELGGTVMEDMPTIEMTHEILHRVRKEIAHVILDAEKEAEYSYFSKLINRAVTGTVKSISSGGLLVLIDRFECFIPRKHLIFGEMDRVKIGNKITGVVESVTRSNMQSQAILSRTSTEFLHRLFENEISEIEGELAEDEEEIDETSTTGGEGYSTPFDLMENVWKGAVAW